jgi:hypothetical protein
MICIIQATTNNAAHVLLANLDRASQMHDARMAVLLSCLLVEVELALAYEAPSRLKAVANINVQADDHSISVTARSPLTTTMLISQALRN